MNSSSQFKNILLIKPGAIGDLIQLTPTVRALKKKYPHASLSLLVGSRATAELFRYNDNIDDTLVFEKKGEHKSWRRLLELWRALRRKNFDLVVNFQRSNLKTWLLASAALPCSVLVYHKARGRTVSAVLNYLETVSPLGISTTASDQNLEVTPGPEDRVFANGIDASLGSAGAPLIALHPGASHAVNRWPPDHFAALADRLASELSARIVIVGGDEDVALARAIEAKIKSARPLVLAGKATLLQLGAVLERCELLVGGDTGPLHLATAVGTRVVALFGAADPARTGPVGNGHRVLRAEDLSCVPCRSRSCENPRSLACMNAITVAQVFDAVQDMLRERNAGRRKEV